jgi:putative MFS transporter
MSMDARAELTEAFIAARLERLPVSRWHLKLRAILGVATFFDAFDSLAIAFVLPALIGPWHIDPQGIGFLISIGYAGQAIGALGCGWLADRIGRIRAATAAVLLFGVMSLACAAAQDYQQLFWCRFISGIGLGGEVPIAATYISEIARAHGRGRFFLLYEMVFQVGLVAVASAAAWIVPSLGWRSLFIIGGLPAILSFLIRRGCPESPRWLASKGRLTEADEIVTRIEEEARRAGHELQPLGPLIPSLPQAPMRFMELFSGQYRRRTLVVWTLWACAYLVGYGTTTWLPSLYRSGFDLPLQTALNYGVITSVSGFSGAAICTFLIDRTGRRIWFGGAFLVSALCLATLVLLGPTINNVVLFASASHFAIGSVALALYLYTPELYPTRMRAIGVSAATFWLRLASISGPLIIAFIVPRFGIAGVFSLFAFFAALASLVCFMAATETRNRVLEEVSP